MYGRYVFVYACLKVLLMWSWGGERAAPGLLGPEPCGGDPASTWCWVGQWQVQLEVVLRVWDVPPERLRRDNAVGGLLSETLCFTAAAGQGRMCWCGVWHAWFSSEVCPGWCDCVWVQAGGGAGRLWAAVPTAEQEFEYCIPFSLSSGDGA